MSAANDIVIRANGLAKRYQIGRAQPHDTLRDAFAHKARHAWQRLRPKPADGSGSRSRTEDFWALQDVSFEVRRGEVVGIVGRNGAGKSTLLKVLSRITEPTRGSVAIRGRVASLLEVGTGFHPELTGRENIFLNGAVLGMPRAEIRRKFDEIVAFSEVERFLDTPVKRYSSGMYVRLAFSVAAHLEPDILIVDEVLAVGDLQFQQKCLGKMQDVTRTEGRTILFVSHQLSAIRQLTSRCLLLSQGRIEAAGPTPEVLDRYVRAADQPKFAGSGRHASIREAGLVTEQGLRVTGLHGENRLWLEVVVETDGHPHSSLECFLTDLDGTRLGLYSPGHFTGWRLPPIAGKHRFRLPLCLPPLATGRFGIDVCTTDHGSGPDHYVPNAVLLDSSSLINFPAKWELRKEYAAGYFILDAGDPCPVSPPPA